MALALEKEVHILEIFGDSKLVIDWMVHKRAPKNNFLKPFYEEILRLSGSFERITIMHIYKERNEVADSLSKEGLQLCLGYWHRWEFKDDTSTELDPGPCPGSWYHSILQFFFSKAFVFSISITSFCLIICDGS